MVTRGANPENAVWVSIGRPVHRFAELFTRIGLQADYRSISNFLETHDRLPGDVRLVDAPF